MLHLFCVCRRVAAVTAKIQARRHHKAARSSLLLKHREQLPRQVIPLKAAAAKAHNKAAPDPEIKATAAIKTEAIQTTPKQAAKPLLRKTAVTVHLRKTAITVRRHKTEATARRHKTEATARRHKTAAINQARKRAESPEQTAQKAKTEIVKTQNRMLLSQIPRHPKTLKKEITLRWIIMTFKLCKIKLILFCAAVLMIIGSVTVFAGTVPENEAGSGTGVILGDANCDGIVTISDATCVQLKAAELHLSCDFSEQAADVDGNKEINAADALYIQKWLALFETPYPIGEKLEVPTEPVTEATAATTAQASTQSATDEQGWGNQIYRP